MPDTIPRHRGAAFPTYHVELDLPTNGDYTFKARDIAVVALTAGDISMTCHGGNTVAYPFTAGQRMDCSFVTIHNSGTTATVAVQGLA